MNLSRTDLAIGREIAGRLLDALGIEAYLYELQPRDGDWEVRVECAVAGGWKHCTWTLSVDELLASNDNAAVRDRLLRDWAARLGACKRHRRVSASQRGAAAR